MSCTGDSKLQAELEAAQKVVQDMQARLEAKKQEQLKAEEEKKAAEERKKQAEIAAHREAEAAAAQKLEEAQKAHKELVERRKEQEQYETPEKTLELKKQLRRSEPKENPSVPCCTGNLYFMSTQKER